MKHLVYKILILSMATAICLAGCIPAQSPNSAETPPSTDIEPNDTSTANIEEDWQETFDVSACTMSTTGQNQYFILEPGFQLVLEGGIEVLIITVLDEIVNVDGIDTRVVEEREWKNSELIEVSRNFFAICEETGDVFYFGEDVDMYQSGTLASHSGAWRSGEEKAKFGLIMPGNPIIGMKYFQEVAPGVAMDRAEVISLDETLETPAGTFPNSLKTQEGTALNPLEVEYKTYAPGIGLIQDQKLLLSNYGYIEQ